MIKTNQLTNAANFNDTFSITNIVAEYVPSAPDEFEEACAPLLKLWKVAGALEAKKKV